MLKRSIHNLLEALGDGSFDTLLSDYAKLLSSIDESWMAAIASDEAARPCQPGGCVCCRGEFEITLLDGMLLLEDFIRRSPDQARIRAASQWSDGLSECGWPYPHVAAEIDLDDPRISFSILDEYDCPLLDEDGYCTRYECRPSICRWQGMSFVDPKSGEVLPDACPNRNTSLAPFPFDLEGFHDKENALWNLVLKRLPVFEGADSLVWDTTIAACLMWWFDSSKRKQ